MSPLPEMSPVERVVADYDGHGPDHRAAPDGAAPRGDAAARRAARVRPAAARGTAGACAWPGAVITRQRPGTAKGFVFLTIEDETGIANIIVRPDLFARDRMTIIQEPFLLVEGMLQNQEGVTSVRAERLVGIGGTPIDVEARDFY